MLLRSIVSIFALLTVGLLDAAPRAPAARPASPATGSAAVPAAAIKNLPGGASVATSLSTITAKKEAEKPQGVVQVSLPAPKPSGGVSTTVSAAGGGVITANAQLSQGFDIAKVSQATIQQLLMEEIRKKVSNKDGHFIAETGYSLSDESRKLLESNLSVAVPLLPASPAVADRVKTKIASPVVLAAYLAKLKYFSSAAFVSAIKADPASVKITDNRGTVVNELYCYDTNPVADIQTATVIKSGVATALGSKPASAAPRPSTASSAAPKKR